MDEGSWWGLGSVEGMLVGIVGRVFSSPGFTGVQGAHAFTVYFS